MAFVLSAALLVSSQAKLELPSDYVQETGLGLSYPRVCQTAIIICLVFYVGSKVIMYMPRQRTLDCIQADMYRYLFLVERAHAIRAPKLSRFKDWLWIASNLFIAVGFGSIAVCGFI